MAYYRLCVVVERALAVWGIFEGGVRTAVGFIAVVFGFYRLGVFEISVRHYVGVGFSEVYKLFLGVFLKFGGWKSESIGERFIDVKWWLKSIKQFKKL